MTHMWAASLKPGMRVIHSLSERTVEVVRALTKTRVVVRFADGTRVWFDHDASIPVTFIPPEN